MQKQIKVMRYMGDNTKRGFFIRGRIYKVLVTHYHHSLLTRIFAGLAGDKLPYALVEYYAKRRHYKAEYHNGTEYYGDWRVENNAFIANASR